MSSCTLVQLCIMPQRHFQFSCYVFRELHVCHYGDHFMLITAQLLRSWVHVTRTKYYTWTTCGRYTNNGNVLLDHVIIVYAYIIVNLLVFLSELLVWLGVFLVHLFSQADMPRLNGWNAGHISKVAHAQRGVDSFTRINNMANVYLLLPGSAFSYVFSLIGPLRSMRAR